MNKPQNQGMCGSEEYWNKDISWKEVREVVKTMANGKASGIDGIPGEVYKAITRNSVHIAESTECHLPWEHTRGLDDFYGSFGTEKGRFDGHEQLQRYQFDACVREDRGGSDSLSYQLRL